MGITLAPLHLRPRRHKEFRKLDEISYQALEYGLAREEAPKRVFERMAGVRKIASPALWGFKSTRVLC